MLPVDRLPGTLPVNRRVTETYSARWMLPSASTSARNWPGNLPILSNLRRNTAMAATLTGPTREGGRASRMTPHRTWLVCSAVVAVAESALLWIGYALKWNWLDAMDASALDVFYRYGAAHS